MVKDYEVLLREFAEGKPTALDPLGVADQIRLLKDTLIWVMTNGIYSPQSRDVFERVKNVLNHIERGTPLNHDPKQGLRK